MNLGEAKTIVGSLGFPSKMPGTSYGLPARACLAGSALAKIPGSVCSTCYALGGRASYQMPRAAIGQQRRLDSIDHPLWVDAMVMLLNHSHSGPIRVDLGVVGIRAQRAGGSRYRFNEPGFHRWHDSGDLQSPEHFAKICEVAKRTPQIKHWLPTQELRFVTSSVPDNLTVRVSTVMLDDHKPRNWPLTSSVYSEKIPKIGHICPAPNQDHRCGSCRACWSKDVAHVSYKAH